TASAIFSYFFPPLPFLTPLFFFLCYLLAPLHCSPPLHVRVLLCCRSAPARYDRQPSPPVFPSKHPRTSIKLYQSQQNGQAESTFTDTPKRMEDLPHGIIIDNRGDRSTLPQHQYQETPRRSLLHRRLYGVLWCMLLLDVFCRSCDGSSTVQCFSGRWQQRVDRGLTTELRRGGCYAQACFQHFGR
ncbi:unnamed protein product, partial [Ixodes pacificus]